MSFSQASWDPPPPRGIERGRSMYAGMLRHDEDDDDNSFPALHELHTAASWAPGLVPTVSPPRSMSEPRAMRFPQRSYSLDAMEPAMPTTRNPMFPSGSFDLTHSMENLSLGSGFLEPAPPVASSYESPLSSSFGGSFGAIGSSNHNGRSASTGGGAGGGGASSTSPWDSGGMDTDRLRDQMNQQMAALYQSNLGPSPGTMHAPAPRPLAHSREALLGLLKGSNAPLDGEMPLGSPPSLTFQSSMPPTPLRLHESNGMTSLSGQSGMMPLGSPLHSLQAPRGMHESPHDNLRGPRQFAPLSSPLRSPPSASNGRSTIAVSPDVTKPNDTIKVQVCLLTDECRPGRVLLIGLFRIGQPTNDKPIFVKQILFENKLHRAARHWNTRITFRAPRSPGEFEFRVFEELKPKLRDFERDENGQTDRDAANATGYYSNVTVARSNRLKVAMDYSHFIEFLRTISERFRQNRAKYDTGGILSNLLAFLRLIDQIETVFLHGQALFEDFVGDLLQLVTLDDHEMAHFAATDTIPSPIETFHGTVRNVLNALQANRWLQEFVSPECWQSVAFYQQELYDAVSGLFFRTAEARAMYWEQHYGFEPLGNLDLDKLSQSPFISQQLTRWMEREAAQLIPPAEDFRAERQSIYDLVYHHVVRQLEGLDAELDVFGSSANDFGTRDSDMDMCLVLPQEVVEQMTVEDKRMILSRVVALLSERPDLFSEIDTTRLSARIPIVMFRIKDSGLDCDLCVENELAQRNTSLLRAYAHVDERVRILAFVLKQFVKRRRMNCAAESTLSSYGYLLLLIHFLQQLDPPVLPVLQTLPPDWKGEFPCSCTPVHRACPNQSPTCALTERLETNDHLPTVRARAISSALDDPDRPGNPVTQVETYFLDPFAFPDPSDKLETLQQFAQRNTLSVGALFVRFLWFYGFAFDASQRVVSVRMGRVLRKSEKKTQCQWKLHSRLSIEDPFETSYDVAHVLKGTRDKYIRQQFVRAFTLLAQSSLQGQEGGEESVDVDVDAIMSILNEPVLELPFHGHPMHPPHVFVDR